jgi:hypothetical protein
MERYTKIAFTTVLGVLLTIGIAAAQVPAPAPDFLSESNAAQTRDQLFALMDHYPPTLRNVLQTDPSLLENKEYMAPYPGLAAFVAKHPEIRHNANYFLGAPAKALRVPIDNRGQIPKELAQDTAIMVVLITIAGAITWIVKSFIDYRRWASAVKTQTDVHSRLMDRLTSSEDLLAYIQSPAGKRFLESGPIAQGVSTAGPMLNRILWSVQAGMVLGLAGVGLSYSSQHVSYEVAQPFFVLGVLGIAVGAGFILSAVASYIIARNMGLVHGTSETPPT